jgi:hypothetical protein
MNLSKYGPKRIFRRTMGFLRRSWQPRIIKRRLARYERLKAAHEKDIADFEAVLARSNPEKARRQIQQFDELLSEARALEIERQENPDSFTVTVHRPVLDW